MGKIYRLMIEPKAQVLISYGEKWMQRSGVTDEKLREYGQKKHDEQAAKGKTPCNPNHYVNKKNAYKRYADYKEALREEARRVLYFPRTKNIWIRFYIPIPKSYSKKKRQALEWEGCETRSDLSNLVKAFEDALFEEDKVITDYRASKIWTPTPFGFIEIEIDIKPEMVGYTKVSFGTDELK